MRVLVTGATGFLGRRVVAEFLRRGHTVRVLVRPFSPLNNIEWAHEVEAYRADLRSAGELTDAFDGVDALVHLAAAVKGDEDTMFLTNVVGTERLLEAMAASKTRRLILASSFSVYAWSEIQGLLEEGAPIEQAPRLYERDSYAIAKVWQERTTRRLAQRYEWSLTVLRPGFIWGRGGEYFAALGCKVGLIHLVIGPATRIPLIHVDNCADLFVTVTECPNSGEETFNAIDNNDIRIWKHLGEHLKLSARGGFRLPVPYRVALALTWLSYGVNQLLFKGNAKLPSILVPCRFQARFKPLRFSNRKAREVLGWIPPWSYEECLRRTYHDAPFPNHRH